MALRASVIALVFAVYWPCLRFPFIQDDWSWLAHFRFEPSTTVLAELLSVKGSLFFRPLAGLWLYSMYGIFGTNPIPYHVALLVMLAANTLLVTGIMRVVTGDRFVSYATGFVYASASAVHLECMLWAVGVYDLGGSFLFLASLLLFLKGRFILSATAFFAGCLFKEGVYILPIIFAGFAIADAAGLGRSGRRWALRQLAPLAVAWFAIIMIRLFMISPFSLAAGHAYSMAFSFNRVVHNSGSYLSWMVQSFVPFLASSGNAMKVVINVWLILLAGIVLFSCRVGMSICGDNARRKVIAGVADGNSHDSRNLTIEGQIRTIRVLAFWTGVALAPVILLASNRSFRYYTIYSLPAFIGITFLLLQFVGDFARLKRRYLNAVIVAIASAAVILSLIQTHKVLEEGLDQTTGVDGTNLLVKKGATVKRVHDGLMRHLPTPPNNADIFIVGANMGAIGISSAVRVWYDDESLNVYPLIEVIDRETLEHSWLPVKNPVQGQIIQGAEAFEWEPGRYFAFELRGDSLAPIVLIHK